MLIIGLKNSSFWLSWAIIYGFIILFNSVIATIILYQYKLMPHIQCNNCYHGNLWFIMLLCIIYIINIF